MSTRATSTAERRADLRQACSVLTDILLLSHEGTRFFGHGIITDISPSGAAVLMDTNPPADVLVFRNSYFEARCEVRNRVRLPDHGHRIGVQFSSEVVWKQPAAVALTDRTQGPSLVKRSTAHVSGGRAKPGTDRSLLERLLASARRRLGFAPQDEAAGCESHQQEDGGLSLPRTPALLHCRSCHTAPCCWKHIGDLRIPLALCRSCLIKAVPFKAGDESIKAPGDRFPEAA